MIAAATTNLTMSSINTTGGGGGKWTKTFSIDAIMNSPKIGERRKGDVPDGGGSFKRYKPSSAGSPNVPITRISSPILSPRTTTSRQHQSHPSLSMSSGHPFLADHGKYFPFLNTSF